MGALIYGGVTLTNDRVFADASNAFVTPEKDLEFVSVPGRDGDLAFSNDRFKNVKIPVDIFIKDNASGFQDAYNTLMAELLSKEGYQKLVLPNDTTHYRQAMFYQSVKADTGVRLKAAKFTLQFDCKPYRYLNSGDTAVPFTAQGTKLNLVNPTKFKSKPIITIYPPSINLTVNHSHIISTTTIPNTVEKIEIDCETMTALAYDSTEVTSPFNAIGEYIEIIPLLRTVPTFPYLHENGYVENGVNNYIWFNGSGGLIKITPRWVTI